MNTSIHFLFLYATLAVAGWRGINKPQGGWVILFVFGLLEAVFQLAEMLP